MIICERQEFRFFNRGPFYHRLLFLDLPDPEHRGRVSGRRTGRPSLFDRMLRLLLPGKVLRLLRLRLRRRVAVREHLPQPEADGVCSRPEAFLEQKKDDAVLHQRTEHLRRQQVRSRLIKTRLDIYLRHRCGSSHRCRLSSSLIRKNNDFHSNKGLA